MSRYPQNIIILIGTSVLLGSCSLFNDDEPERTYPKAYGFDLITFQNFLETQSTDSLNVEVYVAEIMLKRDCPNDPNVLCVGDRIVISDTKHPEEDDLQYSMNVDNSRQFQQARLYRMSFSIKYTGGEDQDTTRRFMGYSIID